MSLALTTLDDAELLKRVALGGGDARPAAGEFYGRHVRYLYGALLKRQRRLLDVAAMSAEDLVQDTFRRAFERAHTFKPDAELDQERKRRRARAWLGRIAHNLLADQLRGLHEVSASPYLEQVPSDEREEAPPSTPEVKLMRQALETLSEREQDVLRVTALYQHAGSHQRLPNDVSQNLARRWGTSNENVRAIRSRALKKVKNYFTEHGLPPKEAP
ncbi:MAG: sigma-70 family RNA polymerase sigma factor [Polyangiaceae bacterium]